MIRGHKGVWPRCGGVLTGEPEDPAFPVVARRRYTSRQVMKIAVFVFLVLETAMVTIRYLAGTQAVWATAVFLWAPLGLVGVFVTMAYRHSVLKLISAEAYIAMILNMLIDRYTGNHGWAVTFVVPSLFLAIAISTFIAARCLKLAPGEYLMYLITAEALSFLQMIFIANGRNFYKVPAVITMALMLVFLFAELIFLSQDFRNTTAKTLHL